MILHCADSCTWQLCCFCNTAHCHSRRGKCEFYILWLNWGMEDICTWINCILTTVRQLRISESRRHELFLFVTCKLSLAFVYFMYYCDPMAVYQGELVIKRVREQEASVIEAEDRKLDETLFLFSLISICSFNNYFKVSHSHCYWR